MTLFPDASPERPVFLACECGERVVLTAPPESWPPPCPACRRPVIVVDPESVRDPRLPPEERKLLDGPGGADLPARRAAAELRRIEAESEVPGFVEEGQTFAIERRSFTGKRVRERVVVRPPEVWGMESLALALWLATAFGLMIGHAILSEGDATALTYLAQSALFALATTGFVLFQQETVGPTLRAPTSVGFWLLLAVKLVPVTVGGVLFYFWVLGKLFEGKLDDPAVQAVTSPESSLPVLVLAIGILPGFFEELGFRGWMQTAWSRVVPPGRALVLTACLFAVVHFSYVSIGWILPMGLYLGWLRQRSGSLWPGIVAHMGHNTAVVLIARLT